MALSVYGAMKLETLKNFRLVSGQLGLERRVSKIGILDYEFAGDMPAEVEGQFVPGEFVLSSMLYAQKSEATLLAAVKRLIELKTSALAIKTIFFKELPESVRRLSDAEDFPIFMFDNDVYFEDIIAEMAKSVLLADQLYQMEQRIEALVHKNLNEEETRNLSKEINRKFKNHLTVFYCEAKPEIEPGKRPKDLEKICNAYSNNPYVESSSVVFKYKNALMVFVSADNTQSKSYQDRFSDLLAYGGHHASDFMIGYSSCCSAYSGIAQAVREAVWAGRVAQLEQRGCVSFEEIGLYRVLMPHEDSVWMERYYESTVGELQRYDAQHGGQLVKTAIHWIASKGNLKLTAERLFVHENTVRYRINKIHTMMWPDENELCFYEQLALGVRLHLIKRPTGQ